MSLVKKMGHWIKYCGNWIAYRKPTMIKTSHLNDALHSVSNKVNLSISSSYWGIDNGATRHEFFIDYAGKDTLNEMGLLKFYQK